MCDNYSDYVKWIKQTKARCERALDTKLSFLLEDERARFIPLTMKIADKRRGTEFGYEEMFERIHSTPVALVGNPGVGKSTLLLKFALELSEQALAGFGSCIPVFTHVGRDIGAIDNEIDMISCPDVYRRDLRRLLEDGKLCLIFDGTNESSSLDVDMVLKRIHILRNRFPECKYIAGCRVLEFPKDQSTSWELFSVNPVARDQILNHLRQNLIRSEDAERYYQELTSGDVNFLFTMCENPMLLTMVITIINDKINKDPDGDYSLSELKNKGEVYAQFCEYMNHRRDLKFSSTDPASSSFNKMRSDILTTIAYYMQSTKSVYIRWSEEDPPDASKKSIWSIEKILRNMRYSSDHQYQDYIRNLKRKEDATGILWYQHLSAQLKKSAYFTAESNKQKGQMAYFIHQSFGEYFAGLYIRNHVQSEGRGQQGVQDAINQCGVQVALEEQRPVQLINYLLGPNFEQKRNWDAIEFASCLESSKDSTFHVIEEILDFATSYKDANALLLASKCLILNINTIRTDEMERQYCAIKNDCCIWLLDAFKNWDVAFNYELIYAASELLEIDIGEEQLPDRLRDDIFYFSEKYASGYTPVAFPDVFGLDDLKTIVENEKEVNEREYRYNAIYTLGARDWERDSSFREVMTYLFQLLENSDNETREQIVKAIKNLLETHKNWSKKRQSDNPGKRRPVKQQNPKEPFLTEEMFSTLLAIAKSQEESGKIRSYALNILAQAKRADAVSALQDYLRNHDNPYRDSASWSLQQLILSLDLSPNERTTLYSKMAVFYYDCLIHESDSIAGDYAKGNLAYTLGKIGTKEVFSKLKKWVGTQKNAYVIEDGISAVGVLAKRLGEPVDEVIKFFKGHLNSEDPVIRAKASYSIFAIGGKDVFTSGEWEAVCSDHFSIVRHSVIPFRDATKDEKLKSIDINALLDLSDGNNEDLEVNGNNIYNINDSTIGQLGHTTSGGQVTLYTQPSERENL